MRTSHADNAVGINNEDGDWAEEFVLAKSVKQRKSHQLPPGENLPLSGQMTYARATAMAPLKHRPR